MSVSIRRIRLGGVNCYLLMTADGCVLVDSGYASRRRALVRHLEAAGCRGRLRLQVITHGDTDHTGNCAFVRSAYGAPVAMHEGDAGMAERGDMRWNRKETLDRFALPFRLVTHAGPRPGFPTFTPDRFLADGDRLDEWGLPATVYHTPGHSAGSLSVLTDEGDLFCGDLLRGAMLPALDHPRLHFLVSDLPQARSSVNRLLAMDVRTVYPGHGKPFAAEELRKRGG